MRLLNTVEARHMLGGISADTLRRLEQQGYLQAYTHPVMGYYEKLEQASRKYYKQSDVEQYIQHKLVMVNRG
jgi:hypothetical protein